MSWKEEVKEIGKMFVYLGIAGLVVFGCGYGILKLASITVEEIDERTASDIENKMESRYYKIVWDDKNNLEELLAKYKKGDQTISILINFQVIDNPEKEVDYKLKLFTHKEKLLALSDINHNAYQDIGIFGNKVVNVVNVEDTIQDKALLLKVTTTEEYGTPGLYAIIEGFLWDGQRVYELMPVGFDRGINTNGTFEDPHIYRFTPEFFIDLQYDVIYIEGQGYIIEDSNSSIKLIPFESERQLWVDSDFVK